MSKWECWAYVFKDGRIVADSTFDSADEAWRVVLGWPDATEIERAKKLGDHVAKVEITEVEDDLHTSEKPG